MHFEFHELLVAAVSVIACSLLVLNAKSLSPHRSARSLRQKQAIHTAPVPRLGGIAVFASVLITTLIIDPELAAPYAMFVVGLIPLVSAGLYEDLGRPVSARWRLTAMILSNLFVIAALQVWLPRTGIPLLDPWMPGILGAILTVVLVSGITNAFNLIDGLNGLSSGVALFSFVSINSIAMQIGYDNMVHLSMLYAVAITSFMLFNFPIARLYLGDSGAYLLGFILAWFGVSVLINGDDVSPFAFLLIFGYPILDMLLSIFRRIAKGRSPFEADVAHFHHLVFFNVKRSKFLGKWEKLKNPIATIFIMPFAVLPMYFAVLFYNQQELLIILCGVYFALYFATYAVLARLLRHAEPVSAVAKEP